MSATHTVKGAAARVGLPSRTLRYYDSIGLVCPPRTPSGYRMYGPEEERRLLFVRQARTLGFSLDEIRDLLAVVERREDSKGVAEIEGLLDEKIAAIDQQLTELGAFRERLLSFRDDQACGCSGHGAFCDCANGAAPADQGSSAPAPR